MNVGFIWSDMCESESTERQKVHYDGTGVEPDWYPAAVARKHRAPKGALRRVMVPLALSAVSHGPESTERQKVH